MDNTEELEKENNKYKYVFDSINECIIVIDKDRKIIDCNKAVEHVFGYSQKEVLGESIYFLIKEPISPGKTIFYSDGKTKNGKDICVDISAVDIDTKDQMIVCAVIRDTTEQRGMYKKVDLLNETLAMRVEALKSFQFTIAHDLNSPIRAIVGFSEILEQDYSDLLDDDGKKLVAKIRESANYLGQMKKEIMRLSEISDGKIEINRKKFDISYMVESICLDHSRCIEKPINLTINPGIVANADENLVSILLNNLISNAFNFSSKKDRIEILFSRTKKDGKTVYFIKDNGVGFNMSQYHRLFRPFSRLHSKKDFSGTGIGLSIVKQIVTLHGGEVWADSTENEGATFYFTLGDKDGFDQINTDG